MFVKFEPDPKTGYLPSGVHDAGWCDVAGRFAGNSHRARLMGGLLAACRNLAAAGCAELLLDGSFVTAKSLPGDYDGAWETAGADPDRLDPVLLDFSRSPGGDEGEVFGRPIPGVGRSAAPGMLYRDFFKTDRNGVEKGVVLIDLRSLP